MRVLQYADEARLEELKARVGLLKKLLRQKAVAELKAYRKEMEVRGGAGGAPQGLWPALLSPCMAGDAEAELRRA